MRNYWWLRIMRDVGKYVKECDLCQRIKNRMEELVGKLSDAVHTGVKVCGMDSEMSRLVE